MCLAVVPTTSMSTVRTHFCEVVALGYGGVFSLGGQRRVDGNEASRRDHRVPPGAKEFQEHTTYVCPGNRSGHRVLQRWHIVRRVVGRAELAARWKHGFAG